MAHPFRDQARSSNKSKSQSMGKVNNLDIPIMRAVGENRSGGIHESSASMQHKKQAAADGMKRGGRTKHKAKVVIAAPATPPSVDPAAMAAAGAGSSPVPAPMPPGAGGPPMPGQPPMKRGGRAIGAGKSYPLHGAGSGSGEGRLEKNHKGKPPFKAIKGDS